MVTDAFATILGTGRGERTLTALDLFLAPRADRGFTPERLQVAQQRMLDDIGEGQHQAAVSAMQEALHSSCREMTPFADEVVTALAALHHKGYREYGNSIARVFDRAVGYEVMPREYSAEGLLAHSTEYVQRLVESKNLDDFSLWIDYLYANTYYSTHLADALRADSLSILIACNITHAPAGDPWQDIAYTLIAGWRADTPENCDPRKLLLLLTQTIRTHE
jgi:hypothetical protein